MARKKSGLGILLTIPKGAYQKAARRVAASQRYWKKHGSHSKSGSSLPADKAKGDPATNRDRAVVEVYRFKNRKKAAPFTGYYKAAKPGQQPKITNWTGVRLCTVQGRHASKSIWASCIDGRKYTGKANGDGMYITMKPKKG